VQSNEIINTLNSLEFKEWLRTNWNKRPSELALQLKHVPRQKRSIFLKILQLFQKSTTKLPSFTSKYAAMSDKSFEQCSSEKLAIFKSTLFSGDKMLNITGGLGVDDWAFSDKFTSILSLDCDEEIHLLAEYNLQLMRIHNVTRVCIRAETFLRKANSFDFIYADPDRRSGSTKDFRPENSLPNVIQLEEQLLASAPKVLIKFSPLADISHLSKIFRHLAKIWVVSADNEVKEILALLERGSSGLKEVRAVIVTNEKSYTYSAFQPLDINIEHLSENLFFEPALSLIKADIGEEWYQKIGLTKVGMNSAFYFGKTHWPEFPGRAFEVVCQSAYKPRLLKLYLAKLGIDKANITKRDFPWSVAQIREIFKLKEGGEDYLFFFKDNKKELTFVHGKKSKVRRSLF
jgi:16S rRNA G966 N2-methylase RsmD